VPCVSFFEVESVCAVMARAGAARATPAAVRSGLRCRSAGSAPPRRRKNRRGYSKRGIVRHVESITPAGNLLSLRPLVYPRIYLWASWGPAAALNESGGWVGPGAAAPPPHPPRPPAAAPNPGKRGGLPPPPPPERTETGRDRGHFTSAGTRGPSRLRRGTRGPPLYPPAGDGPLERL